MKPDSQTYLLSVMSGSRRGPVAGTLRAGLGVASIGYRAAIAARNRLYDLNVLRAHKLPAATIAVGNITTGGTGKTPVVLRLAELLRANGRKPAILMRGYRADRTGGSDEQALLDAALNAPALESATDRIPVVANADRVAGGGQALREKPDVNVFILDDAFQHRRVARDVNLVLVSAVEPFGLGRVLPRGLLREPIGGLSRADVILLTHAGEVDGMARADIEAQIRRWNPQAPLLRADHAHTGYVVARHGAEAALGVEALRDRAYYAFCGIGNPESFFAQLTNAGGRTTGERAFPDHHAYTAGDVAALQEAAKSAGADALVTTEKDWVKLRPLAAEVRGGLPIFRATLGLKFWGEDERELVDLLNGATGPSLAMR